MLKVVAALIIKDGKVLIAKRSTGDPNVLGMVVKLKMVRMNLEQLKEK